MVRVAWPATRSVTVVLPMDSVGSGGSAAIVTPALAPVMIEPELWPLKTKLKDSAPSVRLLTRMGTAMVLLVSPAAKSTVPETGV